MPLNTSSVRSSLTGYVQIMATRRDVSSHTLNENNEAIRKTDAVVEGVAVKEQAILANRTLSNEGKATQVAALATETAQKLAFLERMVRQFADDIRATSGNLYTVKPPPAAGTDPLLQYLYGKEIRDRYQSLSPQERDLALFKASEADGSTADAQANRDAVLWAFQQTPGGPMITPDVMRRALEERAQRLNPQTYARLQDITHLHDSLSAMRDSLVNWLRGLGGDQKKIFDELGGPEPVSPPDRRMAAA